MWGTQFHPEKSGAVGLAILAELRPGRRAGGGLMDLYPAIDIRDGGAVRLTQGDFDRQTTYGDPVALARAFAAAGAPWLHVVDLDAARTGRAGQPRRRSWPSPGPWTSRCRPGAGSGPGTTWTTLVAGGLARVVLGTAVLDDPGLARRAADRHPGRWPWASTTGSTATGGPRWPCGAGSRGAAPPSTSSWPGWPTWTWPPWW